MLDRYIAKTVLTAVSMVLLVMVGLDLVFRLLDELGYLKNDYVFTEAVIYVVLTSAAKVYGYLPFAALIGCLVGLGSLATSSEMVVMQAAGISVKRLVLSVMKPALVLVLAGQLIGEFVAPYCDQVAESRLAMKMYGGDEIVSRRGLWNREGDQFMHFNVVQPNGILYGVTVYEFESLRAGGLDKQLRRAWFAKQAIFQGDHWVLEGVSETHFVDQRTELKQFDSKVWQVGVTPALLSLLVLDPDQMSMRDLWAYARYLGEQGQDNRDHLLAFWQKFLQPLSIAGLVVVAISSVFGPMRQVTMGSRVFVGVLVGIGFRTMQNLLGPASLVFGFPPVVAVLVPIAVCLLVGLALLRRVR
jgi:lipopolysaccharide export system permease protein